MSLKTILIVDDEPANLAIQSHWNDADAQKQGALEAVVSTFGDI